MSQPALSDSDSWFSPNHSSQMMSVCHISHRANIQNSEGRGALDYGQAMSCTIASRHSTDLTLIETKALLTEQNTS